MDHTNTPSHPRDRHPRASSRASTSTTSTRQTSLTHSSANTSLSAASPKLPHPSAHPHRPYTTTGTKPPLAPPDTPSPASTFLHERLQRERRVDLDARSAAPDPRGSPARPPSSGSADSRRRGMGAKEMEQTVSTLHKQNFDLKLELYHRRERQNGLEDRLEALRREKGAVEEMNDTLVAELEKRDKAVEEAVAMIVLLESHVETLLREREMVRHVEEAQGGAFRRLQYDDLGRSETPRPRAPSGGSTDASTRAIHRVPSFLSARSDTTENLRSVYLGTHGSLHSLRRPEEDSGRASAASPSLSVLSESSFVSVYGKDGGRGGDPDGRPSIDESLSEMRMAPPSRLAQLDPRQPRSNSLTASAPRAPVRAPAASTEYTSPLQKLERTYSLRTSSSRLSGPETPDATRAEPSPSHQRTKEQKREALRRVLTDAPRGDAGLPPTPDTISTTTLRRCKASDDTLGGREGARLDLAPLLQPAQADKGQPPTTADFARQGAAFFGNVPVSRPRSAGETTASRNGWDSDSDSDAASDIWMQEGGRPGGGESPDLFGFPPSSAWGGKRADMDELISVQAGLLPAGPPPPPNRRSSLQAPTGEGARGRRHARRNSDGVAEGQYPPAAQKPRGLGRLNPFRRSLGGDADTNSPGKSTMGVPSRVRADDEGARATPPPILRNRGASVGLEDDGGVALAQAPEGATPPRGVGGVEGRRKWLGGFRRDARRAG